MPHDKVNLPYAKKNRGKKDLLDSSAPSLVPISLYRRGKPQFRAGGGETPTVVGDIKCL